MKLKQILIATAAASALSMSFADTDTPIQNSFNPVQTKAIEDIVHAYLVSNPEVLIEASQALQKQEVAKQQKEAEIGRAHV